MMPDGTEPLRTTSDALAPNPVIDAYKAGIDRSLLRENLKLTPEERIRKLAAFVRFTGALQQAGRRLHER
jgi:hypothetical protein